jgi:hypothetical protein
MFTNPMCIRIRKWEKKSFIRLVYFVKCNQTRLSCESERSKKNSKSLRLLFVNINFIRMVINFFIFFCHRTGRIIIDRPSRDFNIHYLPAITIQSNLPFVRFSVFRSTVERLTARVVGCISHLKL